MAVSSRGPAGPGRHPSDESAPRFDIRGSTAAALTSRHAAPATGRLPAPLASAPWRPGRRSSRSAAARSRSATRTRSTSRAPGHTKLDLVRYFLAVADGALTGVRGRPMALKRFVDGAEKEPFFQKRAPDNRPGLDARRDADLPVRPDRGRGRRGRRRRASRGSPTSAASTSTRTRSAPRTSTTRTSCAWTSTPCPACRGRRCARWRWSCASRSQASASSAGRRPPARAGIHVNVRIEPRWTYPQVRRAALALARDVERRAPSIATSKWWKEERHGVFLDYNQNAKDRTVASAYSVRPLPDARVSFPLRWDEVPGVVAEDFTLATVPALYAARGRRRRRDRRHGRARWRHCWSCPRATRRRAWATRRGRPTTPSRRASRRGSSRRASGARTPSTRDGASTAGRRRRSPRRARRRSRRATRMPACRPSGRDRARRPPGAGAPSIPVIEIARAATKAEVYAGLERWKARHPEAAAHLEPADVLDRRRCAAAPTSGTGCG